MSRRGDIADARPRDARSVRVRRATYSAVLLKQVGTIDSDASKDVTNSIVLSIPASQGVPGRREAKAVFERTLAGVESETFVGYVFERLGDRRFGDVE